MSRSSAHSRARLADALPVPEVHDLGDLVVVAELLRAAVGDVTPEDIRAAETNKPVAGVLYVPAVAPDTRRVWLDVRTLFEARTARGAWSETQPGAGV